jgi:cold shock CspA family protein
MRFEGKLDKWNDDRGLGYIVPQRGGDPVYVHISAFPADGRRPRIGEVLTFEVEAGRDGQRRAVNVQRPGHKLMRTTHTPEPRHTGRGARLHALLARLQRRRVERGVRPFGAALFVASPRRLPLRWPYPLLADDVVRRIQVLSRELPWRGNGCGLQRHPVRADVVR